MGNNIFCFSAIFDEPIVVPGLKPRRTMTTITMMVAVTIDNYHKNQRPHDDSRVNLYRNVRLSVVTIIK